MIHYLLQVKGKSAAFETQTVVQGGPILLTDNQVFFGFDPCSGTKKINREL